MKLNTYILLLMTIATSATNTIEWTTNADTLNVVMTTTTKNGKNLLIKSATESDRQYLMSAYQDEETNKLLRDGKPLSKEKAEGMVNLIIERWKIGNPFSGFVIFDENETRVGFAVFGSSGEPGVSELIGAILAENESAGSFYKQGIMSAAISVIEDKFLPLVKPNTQGQTTIPGARLSLGKPLYAIKAGGDLRNFAAARLFIEHGMEPAKTNGVELKLDEKFAPLFALAPTCNTNEIQAMHAQLCSLIYTQAMKPGEERKITVNEKHVATITNHPTFNSIKFKWLKTL